MSKEFSSIIQGTGNAKESIRFLKKIRHIFLKIQTKKDEEMISVVKYNECKRICLDLLHHENANVQEIAFDTLMKFVENEGKREIKSVIGNKRNQKFLCNELLENVIKELISEKEYAKTLTTKFVDEYMEFDDVQTQLMSILNNALKKNVKNSLDMNLIFLRNAFDLIQGVKISEETEDCKTLCGGEITKNKTKKNLFNNMWLSFLRFELPASMYKRVLIMLHDKVLPFLSTPLRLTDFIVESYNVGGIVSLLALSSLFVLMQHYNLDYPDFYKKFYSLLTPGILQTKYRARFFYLTDLFLQSTHLPQYLVAAFTKKLARLTLTAQPNSICVIIALIKNFLIRYPNVAVLIHNTSGLSDLTRDPFNMDEPDPAKCKAMSSSFWEIQSLQSHYVPAVAIAAKNLAKRKLPEMEVDSSEKYEMTMDEMLEAEFSLTWSDVPVTYQRPRGICENLYNLWTV